MPDDDLAETVLASEAPSSQVPRSGPSPFDPVARRFVETGELGRGGMGRVFEAHDAALDRPVAIKQSLDNDPAQLARFEREVRITAKLQHPGIVPVLDAGRDDQGQPYYVMRRIEGKPLATLIAETKTLDDRLALVPNVLAAVDACAYAHARGVIHRDIKPWNVLVAPFGETLLIDWGLARELVTLSTLPAEPTPIAAGDDQLTRAGEAYGTPGFMPPEQARGEILDRRADVFALGATLHHTLTGKRPFAGVTPTEALDLAASGEHVPQLSTEIPPALAAIVVKAMAANPRDRYPDAGALAEDLRRFTTGQLVVAHRYTARELLARWLARHRIAVGIAAISLVLLAVVAVLLVLRIVDARVVADSERQRAEERADEVVVSRAEETVLSDPTRSVALLRQLRPGTEVWARASAVFGSAQLRGIARGRLVHRGASTTWISASPDGTTVASVADDGIVYLHDPSLKLPPRRLATVENARIVKWVSSRSLLVSDATGHAVRVSLDGATTIVHSRVGLILDPVDQRGFVTTTDGKLEEVDLGNGVQFAPVDKIHHALRIPGAVIYTRLDKLIVQRDGLEPTVVATIEPSSDVVLAANDAGKRFAMAFYRTAANETIEWEIFDDKIVERGRWSLQAQSLLYIKGGLLAQEGGRSVWLIPNHVPSLAAAMLGPVNARAGTADCVYASTLTGVLWTLCPGMQMEMARGTQAVGALALTKSHLVAAAPSGLLLSWNLDDLQPQRFPLRIVPSLYAQDRLWAQSGETISVDLATSTQSEIGYGSFACIGLRHAIYRSSPIDAEQGLYALDLRTAKRVRIGDDQPVACSRDDHFALVKGRRIEVRDLTRPTVPGKPFESPVDVFDMFFDGDWMVAADRSGALARIDLRTGEITRNQIPGSGIVIDAHGRVAVARPAEVVVWTGNVTATLALPGVARLVVNPAGIVVVSRDHSVSVIRDDGTLRSFRDGSAYQPSVAVGEPYALLPSADTHLTILDLRDGRVFKVPVSVHGAMINLEGTAVVGWSSGVGVVWKIPKVMSEPELRTAIDRATNATIEDSTSQLMFP